MRRLVKDYFKIGAIYVVVRAFITTYKIKKSAKRVGNDFLEVESDVRSITKTAIKEQTFEETIGTAFSRIVLWPYAITHVMDENDKMFCERYSKPLE